MKLIFAFAVIFLLPNSNCFAQDFNSEINRADEAFKKRKEQNIEQLNKSVNADTNRVNKLVDLINKSGALFLNHFKELLPYASEALSLSKTIQNKKGLSTAYIFLGEYYKKCREIDKALLYLDSAIKISYGYTDSYVQIRLAKGYEYKGRIYQESEDYTAALTNYFKALSVLESSLVEQKLFILSNIATIYFTQRNYEKTSFYAKVILKIIEEKPNSGNVYGALNLLFEIAIINKNSTQAGDYLLKMKGAELAENNYMLVGYFGDKAAYFELLENQDSAYFYYKKALILSEEHKQSSLINIYLSKLSRIALKLNKLNEARDYALRNLELSAIISKKSSRLHAYNDLSNYYDKINEKGKALTYLQMSNNLKDSLFEETTAKQNITVAAIYETENAEKNAILYKTELDKKEFILKLQKAESDAQIAKQLFLNNEQQQNILLQKNELLLNKQKLFSNAQQFTLLNKDNELHELAFLKTAADLQTEHLLKGEKQKQLTLIQKEALLKSSQLKTLSQENELNKLKQRQLLFYSIAGLAALLFVGLYFFKRNSTKQVQLKAELEKKEAQFQRSLADVSMHALRSQMNPHFIFNCLNSIKLYTTQNDTTAAANYLTKFSKLIRMALENSRTETITLDAEIEALELYIQLEAMRFKEKIKYSISVEKNVESNFIEIPPMLVQPYVENAIWHGLMHKENGGQIDIHVSIIPHKSILTITIKDNGVGREESARHRSKTATAHKSIGTKVTSERLNLINEIYKTGANVTTENIMENKIVAGTLVTIKIPFD